MTRLPFKQEPKSCATVDVGNADIGVLSIPKYEDLSPNERIYLREQTRDLPDIRQEAVRMAEAIASKTGQRLLEVYNALTSGDSESLGEYLGELLEFQNLMERVSELRSPVLATTVIRYRLMPEWSLENTGDASLIHPSLVKALAEFATKEQNGWADNAELTEEDLGKSEPIAA